MSDKIFGEFITKPNPFNCNEELYMTNSKTLLKYTKNWKYNRPPDNERVDKIEETLANNTYINVPLQVAEVMTDDKNISYICYDGNHRREALKRTPECKVLVHLLRNATEEDIKNRFVIVNSGCPVPELYLGNTEESKKKIIQTIVDRLCINYKAHKSSSKKPLKPNFNRDNVVDMMFSFLEDKIIENEEDLYKKILTLNKKYSEGKHIKLKGLRKQVLDKCKKTGCYLFLKNDFTEDLEL